VKETNKYRTVITYKDHFELFLIKQRQKVREKIFWTFLLIEEVQQIPETYLKHIEGTDGLYEIRVQHGSENFRIFCFFDEGKIVVLTNGFQKKTQKTPKQEITKALNIKKEYYENKKQHQNP
jgi:phage-related protein